MYEKKLKYRTIKKFQRRHLCPHSHTVAKKGFKPGSLNSGPQGSVLLFLLRSEDWLPVRSEEWGVMVPGPPIRTEKNAMLPEVRAG